MGKLSLVAIILLGFISQPLFGQIINFSVYVESMLDATMESGVAFPDVDAGDGQVFINPGDGGMGVFSVSGNEELDIMVTLNAPLVLTNLTKPSNTMDFDLKFAYANTGVNDINVAKVVNGASVRFQLRERESGPAAPPPTPPSGTHIPNITTAYIYLYGSITVGNIASGDYSGNVELTIEYY